MTKTATREFRGSSSLGSLAEPDGGTQAHFADAHFSGPGADLPQIGADREVHIRYKICTLDEADALAHQLGPYFAEPELAAIGLWELLSNAIEHGNLEIGSEHKAKLLMEGQYLDEINRRMVNPLFRHRSVDVSLDVYGSKIQIEIADQGRGFDFTAPPSMDNLSSSPNGRGILITNSFPFWRVVYSNGGRIVSIESIHTSKK